MELGLWKYFWYDRR